MEPKDIYQELFVAEDCQEFAGELQGFSGILMKRDFGPLERNKEYPSIWFNPEQGICEVQDNDGNVLHKFYYRLEA